MNNETRKEQVQSRYGEIARQAASCCCGGSSCCGSSTAEAISGKLGYTEKDMGAVPGGANLGLGCGNPTALAGISPGETVVDLGSGAGFDCFLASPRVGPTGHVIGVDMTPDMISKARENARKGGYTNVEFRPGEIEHLPVADDTADVIISNCVINLSPDKPAVYREIYRVLKPGGRISISDVMLSGQVPQEIRQDPEAYTA